MPLFQGAKFDYSQLSWSGHNGKPQRREFIRHPGSVIILPLLDPPGPSQRLVLIRNLRPVLGGFIWELPAGTRTRDEDPRACAARELEEETGYRAATLEPLGRFYTGPGLTDEFMHAFVARGLDPVGQRPEADETIEVRVVPVAEFWSMVDSGEMADAKSIAAAMLAIRRGVMGG